MQPVADLKAVDLRTSTDSAPKVERTDDPGVIDSGIQQSNRQCKNRTLLYLYSGPYRPDSVAAFLKKMGWQCMEVDIEAIPSMDLLDCDVWDRILRNILSGRYDAVFASPPCGTFSMARRGNHDGGPRQLRSDVMPELYKGLKGLSIDETAEVKVGNILADRAAEALHWFAINNKPWALEQPARRDGRPSMLNLPKFIYLASLKGASATRFPQCMFGQKFEKETEILGNLDLSAWPTTCNHPIRDWVIPWSGERFKSSHPPLKGRQLAIPAEDWNPSMLRWYEPKGAFLTKATAHYPGALNEAIATAIVSKANQLAVHFETSNPHRKRKASDSFNGLSGDVHDVDVSFSDLPLPKLKVQRAFPTHDIDDPVGGLRRPYVSMGKVPKLVNLGVQIRNVIESFFRCHPGLMDKYLSSIGSPESSHFPGGADLISDLRFDIAKVIMRHHPDPFDLSRDWVCETPPDTCLKANFIKLWLEAAQDPSSTIVSWLHEGAPGGLSRHPDLRGIFPRAKAEDDRISPDDLSTEFETFHNYLGVDENEDAKNALQGYIDKGYLSTHDTLNSCRAELGGANPVLSRLGCIVKTKLNEQGIATTKTRIILDAKQSQVTNATERRYASELPRITDAVHDLLSLMTQLGPGEKIVQFVADIVDAFWLIPLHPEERRFFCAKFRDKYMVFRRTAQGSRTAPLTFAAIMSSATRLLQSLLLRDSLSKSVWQDARLEVYVDDPWVAIRGTQEKIDNLIACLLVGWELLGFPIAYHKACQGPIPGEKLGEIRGMAEKFLEGNVIADKDLRSFTGKCMSIASVIHVWKPFITQFYAALSAPKPADTPRNCTWTAQVRSGLTWILTFLTHNSEHEVTKRVWDINEHLRTDANVLITWDASPWGFGATLHLEGRLVEFLEDTPSSFEIDLLQIQIGSSKAQQTMESLGGLVALRCWKSKWQNKNAVLHIRGDNVGALTLFGQLTTHSSVNSIIAREAALDIGMTTFKPRVVEHVPGVTNVTCDSLSRLRQPGKEISLPDTLKDVPRASLEVRSKDWWKSISHG